MNFATAEEEMRERLTEAAALLNHLRAIAPPILTPLDDIQKAQRGLWLVAVYAAFERGTNAVVEAALEHISNHGPKSIESVAPLHAIFHFSRIQSVKDCGYDRVFDSSVALFQGSLSDVPMKVTDNPLAKYLQNVDGGTLEWASSLFGAVPYSVTGANRGRLATLRERRNAVAHGRESASQVGEPYSLDEMQRVYDAADSELLRFKLHMEAYCNSRLYIRAA
ncbi:HEPN domain-containing protein [Brevundimonas vesicularis]|uniref:HEPN domain-containing protein n=1 Tax=Brevundimonas vesicularis TaxID=41276 RepID=UPI0011B0C7BE|nr:HEPN domain-containing protein [Brevundimonas vesicularis]